MCRQLPRASASEAVLVYRALRREERASRAACPVLFIAAYWATRQHGRASRCSGRADGPCSRDGCRAQHAI